MQGKREPFDDELKSLFSDFKATPNHNNWKYIKEHLRDSNTDNLFRQLNHLPVTPPVHNWEKIQRRLPVYIVYRRQIQFISKVAAIFVLAFCLPQLLSHRSNTSQQISEEVITQLHTPTFGEVVEKAVKENQPSVASTPETLHLPKISPVNEAEQLLASILSNEQEFPDSLLDINRLHTILQPIQPLPVISAVARIESLPITRRQIQSIQSETVELNISVPLIFVEEGEAEQLIKLYDQAH